MIQSMSHATRFLLTHYSDCTPTPNAAAASGVGGVGGVRGEGYFINNAHASTNQGNHRRVSICFIPYHCHIVCICVCVCVCDVITESHTLHCPLKPGQLQGGLAVSVNVVTVT